MADRVLRVAIIGDASSLQRASSRASKSAQGFAASLRHTQANAAGFARGVTSSTGALRQFGGALALTSSGFFAGAGLGAAFVSTIKAAADFQEQMNTLKVVSQATDAQMQQVSKTARDLGNDLSIPGASASDAADAMLELSKGGLSVAESMDAARGTLQLAAAAQIDQAQAAQIQVSALNAFKLSGTEAAHVADVLTGAANAAQGQITDFAIAMSQASSSAHAIGLNVDETATLITALAKAGIAGSDAGTSLRVMLQRLAPQTSKAAAAQRHFNVEAFDARGKLLPLPVILQKYATAISGMTTKQRILTLQTLFGTDAQRAANIALLLGTKNFAALEAEVTRQGQASELANAKMKGFNGAVEALSNAVQTLQVNIGTALLPVLTKYVRELANWASDTNNQKQIQKEAVSVFKDFVTVLQTLAGVFNDIKTVVGPVVTALGGLEATVTDLLALKVVSSLAKWRTETLLLKASMAKAGEESVLLSSRLAALSALQPIVIVVTMKFIADQAGINTDFSPGKLFSGFDPFKNKGPGLNFLLGKGFVSDDELRRRQKAANDKALRDATGASAAGRLSEAGEHIAARVRDGDRAVRAAAGKTDLTPDIKRAKATQAQRNQWFDTLIGRKEDRVQDITSLRGQVAALDKIAAEIVAERAKRKDVTRKASLTDELVQVQRQRRQILKQIGENAKQAAADAKKAAEDAKKKSEDAFNALIQGLQIGVDQAQFTATQADDLASLQKIEDAIRARIRRVGQTTELLGQLVTVQGQMRQIAKDARDTAQQVFGELGQGPVLTGDFFQRIREFGGKANLAAFTADLKAQNKAFAELQRNFATARRQGAPAALLAQLRGQGAVGAEELAAIVHGSGAQRRAFFTEFAKSQKQIQQTAAVQIKAQSVTVTSAQTDFARDVHIHNEVPAAMTDTGRAVDHSMRKSKFQLTRYGGRH